MTGPGIQHWDSTAARTRVRVPTAAPFYLVGMGDTQNFIHDIYREKVSRYRVYRDTSFATAFTKLKLS